jgi:hypothetical protein
MTEIEFYPLRLGAKAVISETDAPFVLRYKWHLKRRVHKNGRVDSYAARWESDPAGKRRRVLMHHDVTRRKYGEQLRRHIDHRDGNGLNNRRRNLRWATQAQNQWNSGPHRNNSSGFKGVCFDRGNKTGAKKWKAKIECHGRQINLGRFLTAEEAAIAYNEAALRLFGPFARTNPAPC